MIIGPRTSLSRTLLNLLGCLDFFFPAPVSIVHRASSSTARDRPPDAPPSFRDSTGPMIFLLEDDRLVFQYANPVCSRRDCFSPFPEDPILWSAGIRARNHLRISTPSPSSPLRLDPVCALVPFLKATPQAPFRSRAAPAANGSPSWITFRRVTICASRPFININALTPRRVTVY